MLIGLNLVSMIAVTPFVPMLAILMAFGIPIIRMLLKHQQRMTELIHSSSAIDPRLNALSADLANLKDLVYQQSLAIERLRALPPRSEKGE